MEKGETNVTKGFSVSAMPLTSWLAWNKSCEADYGDVRWLKIWTDHEKAKQYDILVSQIMRKFEEIEQKLDLIFESDKDETEEEKPEVKTFGM